MRSAIRSSRVVQFGNGLLQAVAAYEPHHIKRSAVVELPQAVDGNDRGMFQATGDFCLHEKSVSTGRFLCVFCLDLLESNFPVQFRVHGDRHLSQSATGMRPQNAKASTRIVR